MPKSPSTFMGGLGRPTVRQSCAGKAAKVQNKRAHGAQHACQRPFQTPRRERHALQQRGHLVAGPTAAEPATRDHVPAERRISCASAGRGRACVASDRFTAWEHGWRARTVRTDALHQRIVKGGEKTSNRRADRSPLYHGTCGHTTYACDRHGEIQTAVRVLCAPHVIPACEVAPQARGRAALFRMGVCDLGQKALL